MISVNHSASWLTFISSMQMKDLSMVTKAMGILPFSPRRMVEAIGQEFRRQTCLLHCPTNGVMFFQQKELVVLSGRSAEQAVSGKRLIKDCIGPHIKQSKHTLNSVT